MQVPRHHVIDGAVACKPYADPFAVLGLERSATAADVKKAFHRTVLLVHPDKAKGCAERAAEAFAAAEAAPVAEEPTVTIAATESAPARRRSLSAFAATRSASWMVVFQFLPVRRLCSARAPGSQLDRAFLLPRRRWKVC